MEKKTASFIWKDIRKCRGEMACIFNQELKPSWGSQGIFALSKNDEVKQTTVLLVLGEVFSIPIIKISWENVCNFILILTWVNTAV